MSSQLTSNNKTTQEGAIEILSRKVNTLITRYVSAQDHITRLENENKALKQEVEALNKEKKDFPKQDSLAKIADYKTVEGKGTSDLKEKLDNYIADLEDCISQIEAQISHPNI